MCIFIIDEKLTEKIYFSLLIYVLCFFTFLICGSIQIISLFYYKFLNSKKYLFILLGGLPAPCSKLIQQLNIMLFHLEKQKKEFFKHAIKIGNKSSGQEVRR
jgi:hypothetical protein